MISKPVFGGNFGDESLHLIIHHTVIVCLQSPYRTAMLIIRKKKLKLLRVFSNKTGIWLTRKAFWEQRTLQSNRSFQTFLDPDAV